MTVFAIFTYTEFFKHKSAEGEKMNKKTTGIIDFVGMFICIINSGTKRRYRLFYDLP